MPRRAKLSQRIAEVVRRRGVVSVRKLADELRGDPRVPGPLELTVGDVVLVSNVSHAFKLALSAARDSGYVELVIGQNGAIAQPGRVERARLERALLQRSLTNAFHPYRA